MKLVVLSEFAGVVVVIHVSGVVVIVGRKSWVVTEHSLCALRCKDG
jgi:hypothetical protein